MEVLGVTWLQEEKEGMACADGNECGSTSMQEGVHA